MKYITIIFILLAVSVFGQGHPIDAFESNPPDSCILAWTFNEGPGAKDWSKEANDGDITGATYADAKIGKGFDFNSSNPDRIETSSNIGLTGAANRTISFWMKSTQAATGALVTFGGSGNSEGFGIWILDAGGQLLFWGSNNDQTGTNLINGGAWNHIVATYDGTTVLVYVNTGLDIDENKSLSTAATELWVGQPPHAPEAIPYNGLIDEVIVFNRTLSLAEIKILYQKGKAGK